LKGLSIAQSLHLQDCSVLELPSPKFIHAQRNIFLGGDETLITPLRKRRKDDGSPYIRRHEIEVRIAELKLLPRHELLGKCAIRQKDDPNYVPSECLLHCVRIQLENRSDATSEKLLNFLLERIAHQIEQLEWASANDGLTLTSSMIQERVLGQFVQMLAEDCKSYQDKLDYFEINFQQYVKKRYLDAVRSIRPRQNLLTPLDSEDTGEPTLAAEQAAGSFDPFNPSDFSSQDYRFALQQAIDTLPSPEREVIILELQGFRDVSKDPTNMTISQVLGKTPKTIRKYRDRAYAALRIALTGEK
jgi:hypothetical protein